MSKWFMCMEHPEWIFENPSIASGTEASIYVTCKSQNSEDCAYVAKFYILEDDENEDHFQNEVAAYRILNTETREEALAPKMHDSFKCQLKSRAYGIIILDDLPYASDRVSPRKLIRDFVKLTHSLLRRHGMVQGDIHHENIMYDSKNRPYLVDF